jgi:hypothetical protein
MMNDGRSKQHSETVDPEARSCDDDCHFFAQSHVVIETSTRTGYGDDAWMTKSPVVQGSYAQDLQQRRWDHLELLHRVCRWNAHPDAVTLLVGSSVLPVHCALNFEMRTVTVFGVMAADWLLTEVEARCCLVSRMTRVVAWRWEMSWLVEPEVTEKLVMRLIEISARYWNLEA